MALVTDADADLYRRGIATVVAACEEIALGAAGATVQRTRGVAAAVFPAEPERTIYNNAILVRDLTASERVDALRTMEDAYAAAGVTQFRAWIHERDDGASPSSTSRRGRRPDGSCRPAPTPVRSGLARPAHAPRRAAEGSGGP